jgi:hypothetical protein
MAPFTNVMDFLVDNGPKLLDNYYKSECFTGRLFDLTAGGADRFTGDDVVAVDWLGVTIPREAHPQLLVTRADECRRAGGMGRTGGAGITRAAGRAVCDLGTLYLITPFP